MAFRLLPVESIGEGIARMAREEIGGAIRDLSEGELDRGEAIHEARKHVRRMRALLRMIRGALGEQYAMEVETYRQAGQILSRYRDADVMVTSFDHLALLLEDKLDPELHARLGDYLRKRSGEVAAGGEGIDQAIRQVIDMMKGAFERPGSWQLDDCGSTMIGRELQRSYRRTRHGFNKAIDDRREIAYHDWRKESRVLRYQITAIEPCWPEFFRGYRKGLEHLADLLGESHDLSLLGPIVLDASTIHGSEQDVGFLMDAIEWRQSVLRLEAEGLGRRLFAERPSSLGENFARYWKAWRKEGVHPELTVPEPEPQ